MICVPQSISVPAAYHSHDPDRLLSELRTWHLQALKVPEDAGQPGFRGGHYTALEYIYERSLFPRETTKTTILSSQTL